MKRRLQCHYSFPPAGDRAVTLWGSLPQLEKSSSRRASSSSSATGIPSRRAAASAGGRQVQVDLQHLLRLLFPVPVDRQPALPLAEGIGRQRRGSAAGPAAPAGAAPPPAPPRRSAPRPAPPRPPPTAAHSSTSFRSAIVPSSSPLSVLKIVCAGAAGLCPLRAIFQSFVAIFFGFCAIITLNDRARPAGRGRRGDPSTLLSTGGRSFWAGRLPAAFSHRRPPRAARHPARLPAGRSSKGVDLLYGKIRKTKPAGTAAQGLVQPGHLPVHWHHRGLHRRMRSHRIHISSTSPTNRWWTLTPPR